MPQCFLVHTVEVNGHQNYLLNKHCVDCKRRYFEKRLSVLVHINDNQGPDLRLRQSKPSFGVKIVLSGFTRRAVKN